MRQPWWVMLPELSRAEFSCSSRRHCSTLSATTCRVVTLSRKTVIFPGKSQAPYFVLCETTDHPTVLFHQTRQVGVFSLNEQRSQDQGKLLQRNVLLKMCFSIHLGAAEKPCTGLPVKRAIQDLYCSGGRGCLQLWSFPLIEIQQS